MSKRTEPTTHRPAGRVTVHLHGTLAARTGLHAQTCEVEVPGAATLGQVFDLVAQQHGRKFLDVVVDSASVQLQPYVHVLVNSEPVQRLKGLETQVDSGDRVTVMIDVLVGIGGG